MFNAFYMNNLARCNHLRFMVHNHRRGRKEPKRLEERIGSGPRAIRAIDERLGA